MRRLVVGLIAVLCAAMCGAEEKPAPVMPSEVTLTSGRVLRNVQVVRWESNRVVLKYSGGVDPIAFALFKSPAPSELPAMRLAWETTKTAQSASKKATEELPTFTIAGQAYDKGMEQAYKFVDMEVGLYPTGQEFERLTMLNFGEPLPAPLVFAVTDADGKFTITTTAKEGVLYARAVRSYRIGTRAVYEWKIAYSGSGDFVLSGSTAKVTPLVPEH